MKQLGSEKTDQLNFAKSTTPDDFNHLKITDFDTTVLNQIDRFLV